MWEFTVWILAVVLVAFFIFSVVFTLISCSDLENNYLGPIEMASRINQIAPFEYGAHLLLTVIMLLTGNVLELIVNAPLVAFNGWLVFRQKHKIDETRILQSDNLATLRKRELIKLIFFLVTFFLYLYNLITSAIETSNQTSGYSDYSTANNNYY